MDPKDHLHAMLRQRRADLLATLDGLGEHDVRRPLTPTGTNLLGLAKHVASVQLGYFGEVFGRVPDRTWPWLGQHADHDADLWAPAAESREMLLEFVAYSDRHADATIEALDLDAPGVVPWWQEERRDVTLGQVLVHVVAEAARHAGHADIVRELVDGRAGQRPGDVNVPDLGTAGWGAHVARVQEAADAFATRP